MISEKMTDREFKFEIGFHIAMAIVWLFIVIMAFLNHEIVTWRLGVIAVSYLALDELVNVYFYWRHYHGTRVSPVQEKEKEENTEKIRS